ncbi:autotransporter outer membrane beta-barrel domain-containing protein [Candidatus Nucleicultrix amoebiphila]|jgi:opacity protein-like surface antigen|uniref:Autotransporter domain-containing protein n=1 Tax=Candidatus Nucleicultrix amoebiphila FS5 TaxID=1414854 RepID=A0A1W6N2M6_9PROT|nr:autotransporter outer membrane beta-barrel domain-containing protein [Candidatus Nucleicultrix amoebiphila]ARN84021.1 hypothetical protein GQ61_00125 [Candidatus Nucleicultrix amoebiphila FS5]
MKKITKISLALLGLGLTSQANASLTEQVYIPAAGVFPNASVGSDPNTHFPIGSLIYTGNPNDTDLFNDALGFNGYLYVRPGSIYAAGDYTNQHASVAITEQVMKVSLKQTSEMIRQQVATRFDTGAVGGNTMSLLPTKGSNAGSMGDKFDVWTAFNFDHIDDASNNVKWDGNMFTVGLGGDYKINKMFLVGLGLTYNYLNGSTKFNRGSVRENGFGVVPYAAAKFTKWFMMDAFFSYNWMKKDYSRQDTNRGATSGKPNSGRWYAGIYANLMHKIHKTNLLARLGYQHAEDKQDAFNETSTGPFADAFRNPALSRTLRYRSQTYKLNRLDSRLQAGYEVNNMFEPYLFAIYTYDFTKNNTGLTPARFVGNAAAIIGSFPSPESTHGKHTWGGGLGLAFKPTHNWRAGLEYTYSQNKKLQTHAATARLGYRF